MATNDLPSSGLTADSPLSREESIADFSGRHTQATGSCFLTKERPFELLSWFKPEAYPTSKYKQLRMTKNTRKRHFMRLQNNICCKNTTHTLYWCLHLVLPYHHRYLPGICRAGFFVTKMFCHGGQSSQTNERIPKPISLVLITVVTRTTCDEGNQSYRRRVQQSLVQLKLGKLGYIPQPGDFSSGWRGAEGETGFRELQESDHRSSQSGDKHWR